MSFRVVFYLGLLNISSFWSIVLSLRNIIIFPASTAKKTLLFLDVWDVGLSKLRPFLGPYCNMTLTTLIFRITRGAKWLSLLVASRQ